jgi:hypothetical protein
MSNALYLKANLFTWYSQKHYNLQIKSFIKIKHIIITLNFPKMFNYPQVSIYIVILS